MLPIPTNSVPAGPGALAAVNTWTSPEPIQSLGHTNTQNRQSYEHLRKEPAIARIVIADEDGNTSTYFVCRAMPVTVRESNAILARYRAPVGRLASLPVGSEFALRRG